MVYYVKHNRFIHYILILLLQHVLKVPVMKLKFCVNYCLHYAMVKLLLEVEKYEKNAIVSRSHKIVVKKFVLYKLTYMYI